LYYTVYVRACIINEFDLHRKRLQYRYDDYTFA